MTAEWLSAYGDLYEQKRVSGAVQLIIVFQILLNTYAAEAPREWTLPLSYVWFAKKAHCTTKTAEEAAKDLEARGIILRMKAGRTWRYRAFIESWSSAPQYIAPRPGNVTRPARVGAVIL